MNNNNMDYLHTLERLMVEHEVCIRAIPKKVRGIFEAGHINDPQFSKPNIIKKEVIYLERFKREMLVVEQVPEHAGMFLAETFFSPANDVRFSEKQYYKSLEEVMAAIEKTERYLEEQK